MFKIVFVAAVISLADGADMGQVRLDGTNTYPTEQACQVNLLMRRVELEREFVKNNMQVAYWVVQRCERQ